ncbi:MAG: hypothetical protein CSA95_04715 [Bacteroidetes bacterium]|nr:MAG: hypothetical protein CSA95_04715 [Bacteroidota bacterium]PIE87964.1 MAG: hypothetical protein CSA04_04370 [Bacteroidota bacterium]
MMTLYTLDISSLTMEVLRARALHEGLVTLVERAAQWRHPLSAKHLLCGALLQRRCCTLETGIALQDQHFMVNRHGKPQLEGHEGWHFNKAHSGDWVVVATSDAPLGVDVERVKAAPLAVARRFFSPEEIQLLSTAEDAHRDRLFYQLWTAKEAYLKYLGIGIKYGLDRFSVCLLGADRFEVDDPRGTGCHLHHLLLGDDYQVALCAQEEHPVRLQAVDPATMNPGNLR